MNARITIAREILLDILSIYSPSGCEEAIANYIYDLLIDRDVNAEIIHISGKSYNVIVNNVAEPNLLIAGHMDTIPFFFPPRQKDNSIIYGTGACDAKGSLVAMILFLLEEGKSLPKNISLGFFSDEESSGSGSAHYLKSHKPKFALILEPTDLKICIEGYGALEGTMYVRTRCIHPAVAHALKDENSILRGMDIIKKISDNLATHSFEFIVYAISAGRKENYFVPNQFEVAFDIIIPFGKTARECLKIFRELSKRYEFTFSVDEYSDPFRLEEKDYIERIENAYSSTFGKKPQYAVMRSWTDANNFARHNIPTVIFGPGSLHYAHSEYEKIDLRDIILASEFIKNLVRNFK